jgi:hypothetical protein
MAITTTVYACIGNPDDRLTQARWHEYLRKFIALVRVQAAAVHDEWMSQPTSPRQSACVAFDIDHNDVLLLQHDLRSLAGEYGCEGILWAEAKPRLLPAAIHV